MKRSLTVRVSIVTESSPRLPAPVFDSGQSKIERGGVIGLFDSGVGGLSVLRALARELPLFDLVYFADQKYCPYGPRSPLEICALSARITRFLVDQRCDVIVVACNTASAAALYYLRETFPDIAFIGMEPAVKPAASATRSGKIAVLATEGTLAGELYANTRDEFAHNLQVLTVYPKDWVERVERGDIDSPETFVSVSSVIEPLMDAGVDEIALGCTHYPFLIPQIEKITQGRAALLDPSDAVARQTARIVSGSQPKRTGRSKNTYYTSGDADQFARVMRKLMNVETTVVFHSDL